MKNLDKISTRLKIAKNKVKNHWGNNNNTQGSYLGMAFKISTELVAAVVVSSIIGFILDGWFDTKPLLIIIFFFAIFRRVDISLKSFIILVGYLSDQLFSFL